MFALFLFIIISLVWFIIQIPIYNNRIVHIHFDDNNHFDPIISEEKITIFFFRY